MRLAISFTNLGPYHLARLRALGERLRREGGDLTAYETAGRERKYPWEVRREAEPFERITLFPDRPLEALSPAECSAAMRGALDRDRPDAVAACGYVRPEALAAAAWAKRRGLPSVLMSESQAIDRPRVWWKEAIKRRRLRRFDAALVGGPSHRDYLASLGMPGERVALGYNAVDNGRFAREAERARLDPLTGRILPARPYFLAVARFVPEKNLPALVRAFARYRAAEFEAEAWDLVLCGAGPEGAAIESAARSAGVADAVHRPGFLQDDALACWYAGASAFVLPSLSEPWGLVANEAAACGLPLLISDRCGCAATLVPDPIGRTGLRFDPADEAALAASLAWVAVLPEARRRAIGRRAAEVVSAWGPDRFASGMLTALELASEARRRRGATKRTHRTEAAPS